MKPRELVIVEWVDSHGGNGWQWADEIADHAVPMRCRSVGWVMKRTKDMIVLAASLSGEENENLRIGARGDIAIPMRSVVKISKAPVVRSRRGKRVAKPKVLPC